MSILCCSETKIRPYIDPGIPRIDDKPLNAVTQVLVLPSSPLSLTNTATIDPSSMTVTQETPSGLSSSENHSDALPGNHTTNTQAENKGLDSSDGNQTEEIEGVEYLSTLNQRNPISKHTHVTFSHEEYRDLPNVPISPNAPERPGTPNSNPVDNFPKTEIEHIDPAVNPENQRRWENRLYKDADGLHRNISRHLTKTYDPLSSHPSSPNEVTSPMGVFSPDTAYMEAFPTRKPDAPKTKNLLPISDLPDTRW